MLMFSNFSPGSVYSLRPLMVEKSAVALRNVETGLDVEMSWSALTGIANSPQTTEYGKRMCNVMASVHISENLFFRFLPHFGKLIVFIETARWRPCRSSA